MRDATPHFCTGGIGISEGTETAWQKTLTTAAILIIIVIVVVCLNMFAIEQGGKGSLSTNNLPMHVKPRHNKPLTKSAYISVDNEKLPIQFVDDNEVHHLP